MNQSFRILLLFVFLFVTLSSCKKNSPQPAVATTYMSFKVDGVEHDMTKAFAITHNSGGLVLIMVTGVNQNEGLNIELSTVSPYTLSTGVFPSNYITVNPAYSASAAASDIYLGGHFVSAFSPGVTPIINVNVTTLTSDAIEGTFAFNCINNSNVTVIKNITEGKFKCTITNQ